MLSHPRPANTAHTVILSVVLSSLASALITASMMRQYGGGQSVVAQGSFFGSVSEDAVVKQLVANSQPAVVSIIVSKELKNGTVIIPDFEGDFPTFRFEQPKSGKQKVGGGSGFIVREDGYIVTNRHVVQDKDAEYTVVLQDKREFAARVIGRDPVLDIAVIKIDAEKLPALILGDSDNVFVGQTVVAIGNSLAEFQNSVTKGIISGVNRQIVAGDDFGGGELIEGALQTDAAINPGNSGGPLLDLQGRVLAVNTAMSRRGQLVGFALPINSVKQLIKSAVENGRIAHPWLGVRYQIINDDVQKNLKLPVNRGAYVFSNNPNEPAVISKSPAEKAGIKSGDIIVAVDNVKINSDHSLAAEIAKHAVRDILKLTILRDGKEIFISAELDEFPEQ